MLGEGLKSGGEAPPRCLCLFMTFRVQDNIFRSDPPPRSQERSGPFEEFFEVGVAEVNSVFEGFTTLSVRVYPLPDNFLAFLGVAAPLVESPVEHAPGLVPECYGVVDHGYHTNSLQIDHLLNRQERVIAAS
jgi:hypothetical protein